MGDFYLNQQWDEQEYVSSDEVKSESKKKDSFNFFSILKLITIPIVVFLVGNSFQKNMTSGIDKLNLKMDLKFNGMEEKMDLQFKGMDLKFEGIDLKLENMGKRMGLKFNGMEENMDLKLEGVEKNVDSKFKSMERALYSRIDGMGKNVNLKFINMENKTHSNIGFIDELRQCTIDVMAKLGYPPEKYKNLIAKTKPIQESESAGNFKPMVYPDEEIHIRRYKITSY